MERGDKTHLYEIKSSATLQPDYIRNMTEVAATLPGTVTSTVIFNGDSFPPAALNIRDF